MTERRIKHIHEWWNGAWWVWILLNEEPIGFVRSVPQPPPPVLHG